MISPTEDFEARALEPADRICEWARMDVRQLAHEWDVIESERDVKLARAKNEGDRRRANAQCLSAENLIEHIAIFLHGEDEWSRALG